MRWKVVWSNHTMIYVIKTGNVIKTKIFVRRCHILSDRSFFYFSPCSSRLMRQWDVQQQVFKTSRLIRHQEYGTFESNRGNISGHPGPSNSTPMTMHNLSQTSSLVINIFIQSFSLRYFLEATNTAGQPRSQLSNNADQSTMLASGAKAAQKH